MHGAAAHWRPLTETLFQILGMKTFQKELKIPHDERNLSSHPILNLSDDLKNH
jgi:hypothetical protein